ncbi:DNA repair protein Sae2/CtIP [Penicillium alfredii]|uniref:DNA repair protein Sae2/CtIP n=1 Tax=Penicillium alfredii TaxID=1506179 RepID=A0A9W9FRU9_9EURO|nr:DNA repair protein Sae2/CtIP [Penicillium alfredii]KAJ5105154.1 DNA repair protein Sae2/CtIP [Penicillium alfredii]
MEVLRELHVSAAKAWDDAFDNAYRLMESELARRDAIVREAEHRALSASQAQSAAESKVQQLQRKISGLQEELKMQHELDPSSLELPRQFTHLQDEFDPKHIWKSGLDHAQPDVDQLRQIVESRYSALYTNLQTFIQTWNGLKFRVLQHKQKLREWEKQLERDEFTFVVNGAQVTFQKVASTSVGDVERQGKSQALDPPRKRLREGPGPSNQAYVENETTNFKQEESQGAIPEQIPEPTPTQSSSSRHDRVSSPSDELNALPDMRTQKRRRVPAPNSRNLSHSHPMDDITERPVLIKSETLSSSPVHLRQLFPSTQDLDEIGDIVQTPTKKKAVETLPQDPDSLWDHPSRTSCELWIPPERQGQHSSVLQLVDGNARALGFSDREPKMKSQKGADQRGISSLADDGDEGDWDSASRMQPVKSRSTLDNGPKTTTDGHFAQRRLHDLLERSAPSKSHLDSPQEPSREDAAPRRSLLSSATRPRRAGSRADQKSTRTDPDQCPDVDRDDEPYRARPLHRLRLDHFKINPTRNQGLDFAFDTVVRKRDDRKCMAGCTRPGCCGDRFRAMARLGGGPVPSGGKEQETEDRRILEEYVGDNQQLLERLNDDDRQSLLVEARARDLANQYGRHRHQHQRPRTPPGFWRTDMPDTQEAEADREVAGKLEREKVEERYREAMRPGGMWTWADE